MTSFRAQECSGLLRIMVSTRAETSFSLRVLDKFTEQWKEKYPNLPVVDRHTFDIPHISYEEQEAGRVSVTSHNESQKIAFSLANTLTDELLSCKHLVIATPMFNWGPPSSLKAWIDRVINCRTYYGHPNHLHGLPITCIIASGGAYTMEPLLKHDHLRPMLKEWFEQMGAKTEDIQFINAEPTGPIDYGKVQIDDPNSGYSRAISMIPKVVGRLKEA